VGGVRRAAGGGVGVGGLVVVGGQAGGEVDVVSADSGIALAKFRVQEAVRDRVNGGGGGGGGGSDGVGKFRGIRCRIGNSPLRACSI